MQITLPVTITYKGRSISARALHDTGAETFAFIDKSIASQLGLLTGEAVGYNGIAGSDVGFKSTVDNISITGVSGCSLGSPSKPVPVMVGSVSIPNVQLLVGEYFMKSVKLTTSFDDSGKTLISCGSGVHVVTEPIPKEYLIIGGAIILLVGTWLLFGD